VNTGSAHAGLCNGLSRMKGNFHVRFLGEGAAATPLPYPTCDVLHAAKLPLRELYYVSLVIVKRDCSKKDGGLVCFRFDLGKATGWCCQNHGHECGTAQIDSCDPPLSAFSNRTATVLFTTF